MHQFARAAATAAAAILLVAMPAYAGGVILEGGDVLRGEVEQDGDRIILRHRALGTVILRADQVQEVHPDVAPAGRTLLSGAHEFDAAGRTLLSGARDVDPTLAAIDRATNEVPVRDPYVNPPQGERPILVADEPDKPWSYGLGLGMSAQGGNSETFDLRADADVKYERGYWIWEAALAYVYGEQSGVRAAENWHGNTRAERKISGCMYGFGQVTYDRNEFADLEHRVVGVAGVGTVFGKSRYAEFKGEAGGGVTAQKRVPSNWRYDPSAYLGLDYIYEDDAKRRFVADLDFVPNLADFDLSVTTLDMRFEIPCSATLNVYFGLRLNWVFDPPEPGIKPLDTLFTVGFRWRE